MRKRLSSKLLAIVLTIAICATTVLGCLMSVSAETSCYSFGAAEVNEELTEATLDVTFTAPASLPNGIVSGAFAFDEVDADAEDHLALKGVTAKTDGVNVAIDGNYVTFDTTVEKDIITLTLKIGFSKGAATKGKNYQVQLDEVELARNDAEYYVQSVAGAIAKISTECEHQLTVVGNPLKVDEANNYSVYEKSVCTICGEEFGIQFVPTANFGDSAAEELNVVYIETSGAANINNPDGSFMTGEDAPKGTEDDPYIITNLSQLRYLAQKSTYATTHGKFFEIDESIDIMVLQREGYIADLNAFLALDAEETMEYLSNTTNNGVARTEWQGSASDGKDCFAGTLNGNGVRIVGAYNCGGGIMTYANDGATAKNLTVEHCYFNTGWVAGSIFAYSYPSTTLSAEGLSNDYCPGVVTLDGITVHDNYSKVSGNARGNMGALFGSCDKYMALNVNNCLVYDCKLFGEESKDSGNYVEQPYAFGTLSGGHNGDSAGYENGSYKNSVFIGCAPYAYTASNQAFKYYYYTNVYTDQPNATDYVASGWYEWNQYDITVVSTANLKGAAAAVNASKLDWGKTWLVGKNGEYPYLAPQDYVSDTIYWDGANTKTAPTVGGGTKDDPYIISTVAELAYVSGQKTASTPVTDGKYYKIADGIKNIVMQPYAYAADIMALDSAAAVKSYFETNGSSLKQWLHYGWESSTFCGNIDFNNATIYGIYQVSGDNAALFSNADAGAVFSNLAVKNSYLKSTGKYNNNGETWDDYQVGAIVGNTNGTSYNKKTSGFIWFKNIEVSNNYMYNNSASHDRSGVVIGASSDIVYMDNVLVYGNDATYGSGVNMPIWSSAQNSKKVSDAPAIPEGLTVKDSGGDNPMYYNMVRNSIILGADPVDYAQGKGSRFNDPACFQNVYTDCDIANKTFGTGTSKLGAKDEQIKQVSASAITGGNAQTEMPNLTWGTDWYCGSFGKLPTLAILTTVGTNENSTFAHKLYGSSVIYNDDGTFDFNLHFVPQYEGIKATLYVGTKDASKFYKIDATESSYRDDLGENALMFTLPNISARDIDKVWLPTVVVEGGALLEWGQTQSIALADNAKGVIEGDYDTADKKVSAALINYGTASGDALAITKNDYSAGTIDLLEFGQYLLDKGSSSKYYDSILADNGETGESWDNAIIIDDAEEFVYLCKAAGDETKGKYYKVADGIAGFDLSKGNLDLDGTLADNIDKIKAGGKNHAGDKAFQGYFDGNGATVYGAWSNHETISTYAGLFTTTKGEVLIKNIHVKLASFTAKNAVGGIIGYHDSTEMCTVTVENCSVTDSHLEVTTSGYGKGLGAIIGNGASAPSFIDADDTDNDGNTTERIYINDKYIIKNCYVNLDEDFFITLNEGTSATGQQVCHGGVGGRLGSNALSVENCVVIGITPYATSISTDNNDVQHTGLNTHFKNVYTTDDVAITGVYLGGTLNNYNFTGKIFPLTEAQLTGINAKDNMPTLDWDTVWTTTDGYPTFIANGYVPSNNRVIAYTGTNSAIERAEPTTGSGTKDDPIIINTVQELAWVVGQTQDKVANTQKYFKVADGISSIVLQKPEYAAEIMALGSAAETKAYFEANASKMVKWQNYGWEGSTFAGNIDFNGATVYGAYIPSSTNNAAFISNVDAGAVIKNLSIKNSYFVGTASDYQVAALVACSNSSSYGAKQEGVIWINGCTVANNYLYNTSTQYARSGVIGGGITNDILIIDNCLVYGNDATYGSDVKMPLVGQGNNDVETTKLKPDELPSYVENGGFFCNTVRNSIILDCDVINEKDTGSWRKNAYNCYSNVYTNGTLGETFYNDSWAKEYAKVIFKITAADVEGNNATNIVNTLNSAAIGDTVWYVGAAGDMPGFKEAGNMPSSFQAALDSITFDTLDTVGSGTEYYTTGSMLFGVYQTALSLKANPYMSFAFAFGYDSKAGSNDYKTNRDKITVKFTYTQDGAQVSKEVQVPAYVEGEDLNEAGWTNTTKNGRFHTFKADMIPVEALAYGIKVEASYDGGEWQDFGTYSVEGLGAQFDALNKTQPGDYYATRVEAAKALLFYAQAIAARYGA